eukprot:m.192069 g.192069  ORF g.192069 m.192069 type:complete len:1478 (+) comp39461_c1_seq6:2148-6581(+)
MQCIKSGALTKQGNVRKNWKRRVFQLTADGALSYYKDPLKAPLGSIDVKGSCIGLLRGSKCRCVWPVSVPLENCFGIVTSVRVFHVYADSQDDTERWMSALRDVSLALKGQDVYPNVEMGGDHQPAESGDGVTYEVTVKEEEENLYDELPNETQPAVASSLATRPVPALPPREIEPVAARDSDDGDMYGNVPSSKGANEDATQNPIYGTGSDDEHEHGTSVAVANKEESDGDFYGNVPSGKDEMENPIPIPIHGTVDDNGEELHEEMPFTAEAAAMGEDEGDLDLYEAITDVLLKASEIGDDRKSTSSIEEFENDDMVVERREENGAEKEGELRMGDNRLSASDDVDGGKPEEEFVQELYDEVAAQSSAPEVTDDLYEEVPGVEQRGDQSVMSDEESGGEDSVEGSGEVGLEGHSLEKTSSVDGGRKGSDETNGLPVEPKNSSSETVENAPSMHGSNSEVLQEEEGNLAETASLKTEVPSAEISAVPSAEKASETPVAADEAKDVSVQPVQAAEDGSDVERKRLETLPRDLPVQRIVSRETHRSAQHAGKRLQQTQSMCEPTTTTPVDRPRTGSGGGLEEKRRKFKAGSQLSNRKEQSRRARAMETESERQVAELKAVQERIMKRRSAATAPADTSEGKVDTPAKEEKTVDLEKPQYNPQSESENRPIEEAETEATAEIIETAPQTESQQQKMVEVPEPSSSTQISSMDSVRPPVKPKPQLQTPEDDPPQVELAVSKEQEASRSPVSKGGRGWAKAKARMPGVGLVRQQFEMWEKMRRDMIDAEKKRQLRRADEERRRREERIEAARKERELLEGRAKPAMKKTIPAEQKVKGSQSGGDVSKAEMKPGEKTKGTDQKPMPKEQEDSPKTSKDAGDGKQQLAQASSSPVSLKGDEELAQLEEMMKKRKLELAEAKQQTGNSSEKPKPTQPSLPPHSKEAESATAKSSLPAKSDPLVKNTSSKPGLAPKPNNSVSSPSHTRNTDAIDSRAEASQFNRQGSPQAVRPPLDSKNTTKEQGAAKPDPPAKQMDLTRKPEREPEKKVESPSMPADGVKNDSVESRAGGFQDGRSPQTGVVTTDEVRSSVKPLKGKSDEVENQEGEEDLARLEEIMRQRKVELAKKETADVPEKPQASPLPSSHGEETQRKTAKSSPLSEGNKNQSAGKFPSKLSMKPEPVQKLEPKEAKSTSSPSVDRETDAPSPSLPDPTPPVSQPIAAAEDDVKKATSRFTDVEIRKKKDTAKKRASLLSWSSDEPPTGLLGIDGDLTDDDPRMSRKLSVVTTGDNAQAKALVAARWIDKEIRKLIGQIVNWGSKNAEGLYEVAFGLLFEETSNIFEALSGTLKTAKKHGVVKFMGELLLQGVHNATAITLMKDSISDSTVETYTYREFRACSISVNKRKGKGFSGTTQQNKQNKCFVCGKTVYPMEYVGVDDKAMHKACFRCLECKKMLSAGNYAALDGKFYCKVHFERLYKQHGSYGFT